MDARSILLAIAARWLSDLMKGFEKECKSTKALPPGMDSDTLHDYLLDVVAEACQLIKKTEK